MASAERPLTIVFNGEIYNHQELRAKLEAEGTGTRWRGHSDTEMLLAAFDAWGCAPRSQVGRHVRLRRMGRRRRGRCTLARDRLGEKPLYYGWQGGDASGSSCSAPSWPRCGAIRALKTPSTAMR